MKGVLIAAIAALSLSACALAESQVKVVNDAVKFYTTGERPPLSSQAQIVHDACKAGNLSACQTIVLVRSNNAAANKIAHSRRNLTCRTSMVSGNIRCY